MLTLGAECGGFGDGFGDGFGAVVGAVVGDAAWLRFASGEKSRSVGRSSPSGSGRTDGRGGGWPGVEESGARIMLGSFFLVFLEFGKIDLGMMEVVFFDGKCPWCGGFVSWVARRDIGGRYFYAPLEGFYAKGLIPSEMLLRPRGEWEMCFWDGRVLWRGSSAALRVFLGLGFPWSWLAFVGFCFPEALRACVYRWVAANRPVRAEHCFLPSPHLRARLLN